MKRIWKMTRETFIEKATAVQAAKGRVYDYSLVEYVNSQTKVKIICPEHGVFEQVPAEHNAGKGCNQCRSTHQMTQAEFIVKAKSVHGERYDYSEVYFRRAKYNVVIKCRIHGAFEQQPTSHIMGCGCPNCKYDGNADLKRSTVDEFVVKAKLVHGDLYDYSKTVYVRRDADVIIICTSCKFEFNQSPGNHLAGKGCRKCKNSHGETAVENCLKLLQCVYESQSRFATCRDIFELPFDFWIPLWNLLIEFDGKQHFEIVDHWDNGPEGLAKRILHDKIKDKWCIDNGKILLRISFKDLDNIADLIDLARAYCEEGKVVPIDGKITGYILATKYYSQIGRVFPEYDYVAID